MLQLTQKMLNTLRAAQGKVDAKVQRQKVERTRQLNHTRFQRMVEDTIAILKAGEPTRFAFEGACRQGIRRSLVLTGWRWQDADANAALVIETAFKRMGVERPDWWQGQWEYADTDTSRGWCAHTRCHKPLPIDRKSSNGTPVKYCGIECKQAAHSARIQRDGNKYALAEWLAVCADRSHKTIEERSGNCEACGTPFLSRVASAKFCSHVCFARAVTKHPDKPCERCGTMFKPRYNAGKGISRFCSTACSAEARAAATPRPKRTCLTCNATFTPKYPSDKKRYCSAFCNPTAPKRAPSLFQCDDRSP